MGHPCISILWTDHPGPYGGANQFLRALRTALAKRGDLADDPAVADVLLFNSHHDIEDVLKARRTFPDKLFIHRVDGPMRLYNEPTDRRDRTVYLANAALADATVFQSDWSRQRTHELGWPEQTSETIICNAPDPTLFHPPESGNPDPGEKIRLIATSWSANPNKGFDTYRYLDEHLDFSRFEMVFVGNTPGPFRNIEHVPPLPSSDLADRLRRSDLFITGSRNDPCSNSLIEALHCNLPAIALRSGGHPEILGEGGELFDEPQEIPALLEKVWQARDSYRRRIRVASIDEIAGQYAGFAGRLVAGASPRKHLSALGAAMFRFRLRWGA